MSGKEAKTEAVKVAVRCRPLNSKETNEGREEIVHINIERGEVLITPHHDDAPKTFTFDQVYDQRSNQREVFDVSAAPIVDSVMEGYNGTIFAYGQTGTGKSHTMEGREEPVELRGIIPNTFDHIFTRIGQERSKEYLVRASYLEIYNEDVRDLLSKNPQAKLDLKEDKDKGVFVKDLTQFVVKSAAEINSVLQVGKKNRATGATMMNQDSSRSHSIFTIVVEMTEKFDPEMLAKTKKGNEEQAQICQGKLNLVDLAGSERQSKTGATGDRLKEGIKINLSLTALGNVISALVDGKSGHIPYRDSKLTRLLQDSLGGNTKTVMIANIGPADWNYDETLSTLRYANRAKHIENKPNRNTDPKDAMLREFQDEIKRLKELLEKRGQGGDAARQQAGLAHQPKMQVEDDVDAVRERLRQEMEARMTQDLSAEALAKAREEAEAAARKDLEAIMGDSNQSETARRRAKEALRKQAEEMAALTAQMEAEQKEKAALEIKIQAMESKLLQGGVNLLDKVDELKQRQEQLKREAYTRKRHQEEHRRRLQELELRQINWNEKYNSLDEEIQVKSRQLKKLFEKYQGKKAEIADIQEQFQAEREAMLDDYRILTQQIKLKNLVIACFIPPDYQDKIMRHCHWQDYEGTWSIDFLQYAGNAIRAHQEMATAQEAEANGTSNLMQADNEKLQNVYFSYQSLEERLGLGADGLAGFGRDPAAVAAASTTARPSSAAKHGRPSSSARRRSSQHTDPTHIGTLRDSVAWGQEDEGGGRGSKPETPKARGLVKDTVDPSLRKTVAK